MIRAKIGGNIVFGLQKENIKRLQAGMPIFVNGEDVGISENIAILCAETVEEFKELLGFETNEEKAEKWKN